MPMYHCCLHWCQCVSECIKFKQFDRLLFNKHFIQRNHQIVQLNQFNLELLNSVFFRAEEERKKRNVCLQKCWNRWWSAVLIPAFTGFTVVKLLSNTWALYIWLSLNTQTFPCWLFSSYIRNSLPFTIFHYFTFDNISCCIYVMYICMHTILCDTVRYGVAWHGQWGRPIYSCIQFANRSKERVQHYTYRVYIQYIILQWQK